MVKIKYNLSTISIYLKYTKNKIKYKKYFKYISNIF
jgi:hypothetical protein